MTPAASDDARKEPQFPLHFTLKKSEVGDLPYCNEAREEIDRLTDVYRHALENEAQRVARHDRVNSVSFVHVERATMPYRLGRRPRYTYLGAIGGVLIGIPLTMVVDAVRTGTISSAAAVLAIILGLAGAGLLGAQIAIERNQD